VRHGLVEMIENGAIGGAVFVALGKEQKRARTAISSVLRKRAHVEWVARSPGPSPIRDFNRPVQYGANRTGPLLSAGHSVAGDLCIAIRTLTGD